ncbi:MAG: HEAT repeat domain-containing protein [Phocaeicola sp.]|uniref:HEAT repeat domain-containing protein n=1 Tax=Phocaeicola sp. TaxID=2773926 RepID=UPI003FA172B4
MVMLFVVIVPLRAQKCIKPHSMTGSTSFAVVTDNKTWVKCQDQIIAYQSLLTDEENLPTFILYDEWKTPEAIKKEIKNLYKKSRLEGVVFIGDIPIPMIRKAQHLTSAFKMNEEKYPWIESSVPSDRFYDDFNLEFDFLKKDSIENFYYYDLAIKSPQHIHCDIYSGRIKPVDNGIDPYEQINHYLQKVIIEHRSKNKLDQFFSYTGDGSYSNALMAWTPEAFTLREQMPNVFDTTGRAKFFRYSFYDYPKETIMNQMKREDLDFAIFHEHGTPDRQYISAIPNTIYLKEHIEQLKRDKRDYMRRLKGNLKSIADFKQEQAKLGLDSTWYAGFDVKEIKEADSLLDLKTGIILQDVTAMTPNARMVIFDACYNGDFREKDYIAGRYIFSEGKNVAAFANTVNVLQDKQANELLGLLGMGARIGQWAQLTNILESHIIGDPTFHFESNYNDVNALDLFSSPYQEKAMLRLLNSPYADIQNFALHQLYRHHYASISQLLKHTFETSNFATVRYTSLALLIKKNDDNLRQILKRSIHDPNEFIRRTTINYMGKVGDPEYLPLLQEEYKENEFSQREAFDIKMAEKMFSYPSLIEEIFKPDAKERWRISIISSLKNTNVQDEINRFLDILHSPKESDSIKTHLLQALAWYTFSIHKEEIISACKHLMNESKNSKMVREEAKRTYYRLKNSQS